MTTICKVAPKIDYLSEIRRNLQKQNKLGRVSETAFFVGMNTLLLAQDKRKKHTVCIKKMETKRVL